MANNRMLLVHIPTGLAVHLAKRLALGWYVTPGKEPEVGERLNQLFLAVTKKYGSGIQQDDFALALEDAADAGMALGGWEYVEDLDDGIVQLRLRSEDE